MSPINMFLLLCFKFLIIYTIKLKLLSHPWWILIPQNKTNQNKQQYNTDTHYQENTSLNFTEIPHCR